MWELILKHLPTFGWILGGAVALTGMLKGTINSIKKLLGKEINLLDTFGYILLGIALYSIVGEIVCLYLVSEGKVSENHIFPALIIGGFIGGLISSVILGISLKLLESKDEKEAGEIIGEFAGGFVGIIAGMIVGGFVERSVGGFTSGIAGMIVGGIAGGFVGWACGGIAGMSAGEFASGIAGRSAGGFASGIAGMTVGGFAGGIAGLGAGANIGGFTAGGSVEDLIWGGIFGVIVGGIAGVFGGVVAGAMTVVIAGRIARGIFGGIVGAGNIISILFSKSLTLVLTLIIFRKAFCFTCFHYSMPLKSTYNNGIRYCEHCNAKIEGPRIKKVIGLIGGDVENYKVDGDKVYVNLWFEKEERARNADIDILLIRNSPDVSYDYAINAVTVTLKNDVSKPPDYLKKIPVVIEGKPPIPPESMGILRQEFGKIRDEI